MSTSNNSNQQTLAESGANERPPMLEKGNYIPQESRFRRFLDKKLEDGERMWNSIQNGPYQRPMIPNPNNTQLQILEPLSKMTEGNKKQYIADVKVMSYLLQAIPNDIYNSLDPCKNAKEMWQRIKRLMFGSEVTSHVRHSRLMDEFDKFAAKEGESLESIYIRLTTLVNFIDCNNVRPISVSINTKFLNCLQPEWSKYVTIVRYNQNGDNVSYDVLYDSLVQFEPHVLASKANKAAKNHDPLALITRSNASSSQTHANSSYSPQPYYVTHPSSVVDYDDEYQGELQGDSQKDKLTTAMMMVELTYKPRMQAMVEMLTRMQGDKIGIKCKANVQCYNYNEKGHYARECQKPKVHDAKYFREQMLLAMKDEAGSNLTNEENDFMLDSSYGEDTLKELTAIVMLMAQLQLADDNTKNVASYDAKAVSEVNASSKVHEQHETQLEKKTFKERENQYLEDIVYLEEKLSSYDRIVYKMVQLIQTIHMLGKKTNKVYDPFLKAGLGYQNPEQETLEDAEESRLKMRNKMVQINYRNLNALYETFVPQQEFSGEQTYFSIPSTSNNGSESKEVTSEIDKTILEDRERRWMSDSQNSLREFYKTDVILMSNSLYKRLKEIKEELIEEVQEMLNIFKSMEKQVAEKSPKETILKNEIDQLLEVSLTSEIRDCVLLSVEK
ncbi:putative leucine-rich repeat domain-like protein [Tanacetum coccineum]